MAANGKAKTGREAPEETRWPESHTHLEERKWPEDKKERKYQDSSNENISRLEELRKEHEKASKLKEEVAEKLKVLRSLKKEAEDDLFDLVSRK
ncbi:hypothetical protein BY996DRAFT_6571745 [Phakopsora pachyrhizi]|nr:hypothetical protein BY996DRAFT_6571745 [Phakopsora pachyrhizi]